MSSVLSSLSKHDRGKAAAMTAAVLCILMTPKSSKLRIKKYLNRYGLPLVLTILFTQHYGEIVVKGDFFGSIFNVLSSISPFRTNSRFLNRLVDDAMDIALASGVLLSLGNIFSFNMISLSKSIKDDAYTMLMNLPFISGLISKELKKEMVKLEASLKHELKSKVLEMGPVYISLPLSGMPDSEILAFMKTQSDKENATWREGKVSGSVYHGVAAHQHLLNQAFGMYSLSNPLHPEIWPSAMKYDSEIIAMTASIVSGGVESVCGCTSSGNNFTSSKTCHCFDLIPQPFQEEQRASFSQSKLIETTIAVCMA